MLSLYCKKLKIRIERDNYNYYVVVFTKRRSENMKILVCTDCSQQSLKAIFTTRLSLVVAKIG